MTLKYYYKAKEKVIPHTLQTASILSTEAEMSELGFRDKYPHKKEGAVYPNLLHFSLHTTLQLSRPHSRI